MNLQQRIKQTIKDVPDFPKKGIIFKDITPLFLEATLSKDITSALTEQAKSLGITAICGIESRGFLFGAMIAQNLGLPFVLIRKKGKLPRKTLATSYALEYGTATIEIHEEDLPPNSKVLIHDDLLATGGTALAAAELVQKAGGQVVGFSFLVELNFLKGREKLNDITNNIFNLVEY